MRTLRVLVYQQAFGSSVCLSKIGREDIDTAVGL